MKGWKKIFCASGNQKISGVAILISDEIDFKPKTVAKDKEGHSVMIKGSRNQENIAIVNTYTPNAEAPKSIKQILTDMKGNIEHR